MESPDEFRNGMRRLAGGVSIVTALTAEGDPCGITATAVFSLSADPPSLVVGVNKDTRLGAAARTADMFAVNVLTTAHQPIAEAFAGMLPGVIGADRFSHGTWRRPVTGVPILEGAAASFVCKLEEVLDRATHLLVIGAVVDVRTAGPGADPLVYVARKFTRIAR